MLVNNSSLLFTIDINECSPKPCENGGACTDNVGGYTCTCAAGYEGVNCETGELFHYVKQMVLHC